MMWKGLNAFALALSLAVAQPVCAVTLDFESTGLAEGAAVTALGDVGFTGALLVEPGNPRFGFNGSSSGGPGGIDDALTGRSLGASVQLGTVVVQFAAPAVDVAVDLLDVEIGSVIEIIALRVYRDAAGTDLIGQHIVTGGDPGTGDGTAATVQFAGMAALRRLEIERIDAGISATAIPGYGIDNLSYTLVPLPAALPLLVTAVAGLAGAATRRR